MPISDGRRFTHIVGTVVLAEVALAATAQIFTTHVLLSLIVFSSISFIYSSWPTILYWFSVSHGMPGVETKANACHRPLESFDPAWKTRSVCEFMCLAVFSVPICWQIYVQAGFSLAKVIYIIELRKSLICCASVRGCQRKHFLQRIHCENKHRDE